MRYIQAENAFSKALAIDSDYLSAGINKANLLFLREKYQEARKAYQDVLLIAEQRNTTKAPYFTKLLVNLSRACYQLNDYDRAREYYFRAEAIEADAVREYSYLASAAAEGES